MRFHLKKVRANVAAASTDDLLDRATVWREGMEPEALEAIEAELRKRGVGPSELERHAEHRAGEVARDPGGTAQVCYRCERPAVAWCWVWGRFWKVLPMFPRRARVCEEHRPGGATTSPR
jgi:hypothetical protein